MCPIGKAMEISPCELIYIVRGKISIVKGKCGSGLSHRPSACGVGVGCTGGAAGAGLEATGCDAGAAAAAV